MLGKIKHQCLVNILEDIVDNGGQMIDNNAIADHIQSYSPMLSDNEFAELVSWIKDRTHMMIPFAIKSGVGVDALLQGSKQQLV